MTYVLRTRADFVRAGFRLEWKDGEPVLCCGDDWQRFKSREHMAVWIAAGIAEMDQEDTLADIQAKYACREAKRRFDYWEWEGAPSKAEKDTP